MRKLLIVILLGLSLIISLKTNADEVLFDGSQKMSGLKLAVDPENINSDVMFWVNAPKGFRRPLTNNEYDLSQFKALSLRFYSAEADGHAIVVLADSNPDNWNGDGNYFSKKLVIDWKGWKTIVIPFEDFNQNRKPVGWNKINKILLANNGYGGAKPNPKAEYYIDEVKALTKAPPPKQLKEGEIIKLSPSNSSNVFQFKIDPSAERVYGVQYELKGKPGAQAILRSYTTWDINQDLKEKIDIMGKSWNPVVSEDWETNRLEILVKKGSARLQVTLALVGDMPIQVRNVKVIKGGWPKNPPLKQAPYITWIDSLKTNMDYAKSSPLLKFKEGGGQMWDYRKSARVIYMSDEEQKEVEKEVAPFRALSVKKLIELVPKKRPFQFNSGCWGLKYKWDPNDPDKLYDIKTEKQVDPAKDYPIQGYQEVVAPSGKMVKYAYHDLKTGERIYVDQFMTDARLNALNRAGMQMAMLYRKTGDLEYGVRAAAILWAMCRNMPDWPAHGQPGWNSPKKEKRLQGGDYYSWFSFVMGGDWYVTEGNIMWTARYFDLIRDTPAWNELAKIAKVKDPRKETADGLLHIAKMYIKRDAFYRNSEFVTFHNLSGTENRSLILLGRVVGCPDVIHYTLRRITGTFEKVFMADGVFPESMWYTLDQFGRQSQALDCLIGYNDPEGYICSLDGTRLDIKQPKDSIPTYGRAKQALERQTYPDGSAHTVHDSWSKTSNPPDKPWMKKFDPREEAAPYLFNVYGHGILGRGKKPFRIESQLHYGGHFNHGHNDMLNLILWAYGDELLSDIGYSHITQYTGSSFSHNLVMINKTVQQRSRGKGSLLTWNARKGATQVIQADQGNSKTYPECTTYRRALILLPFGEDENAVLDIFEVAGGNRHDWIAHGCRDYAQTLSTSLKPTETKDNLAENRVAVTDPMPWGNDTKTKYGHDEHGKVSVFYGAFRDVKISPISAPWTATINPTAPVTGSGPETKWAGPRARSTDPRPSLRLHWLAPMNGKAYLGDSPRNRYLKELENKPAASKEWAKLKTKKIMVSREGKDLESTFVAAWEPFSKQPFLESVKTLSDLKGKGLGYQLAGNGITKQVLYKAPEATGTLSTSGLASDGRFTVKSVQNGQQSLDLYDGTMIETDQLKAEISCTPALPVIKMDKENGKYIITVKGNIQGPAKYADQFICFAQEGQSNRWIKLAVVESGKASSKLILSEYPGFVFDTKKQVLTETFFPHRQVYGKAEILLPSWLNLKVSEKDDAITILVRGSGPGKLTLKGNNQIVNITPDTVSADWKTIVVNGNGQQAPTQKAVPKSAKPAEKKSFWKFW